jgi:hypothetical protein
VVLSWSVRSYCCLLLSLKGQPDKSIGLQKQKQLQWKYEILDYFHIAILMRDDC